MADQQTDTAAPAPSPGEFSLGDVLSDLANEPIVDGDEEGGSGGGEPEPEAEAKPKGKAAAPGKAPAGKGGKGEQAAPETSKDREKRHGEGKLRDDLSDERPWTPERIKAAADDIRGMQRHAQRMWATEQSRAAKLEQKRSEQLKEFERFRVDREHFAAQQRLINSRLSSTDPNEVISCLGLLTGRDGAEVLEELNVALAHGKKRQPSRLEREQATRLEALEQRERERLQQAEQARIDRAVEARKGELAQHVLDNADDYPELAMYEADEIGEALAEIKTRRHTAGRPVSDAQAAKILEADLQKRQREREAKAGVPQGTSGLAPRAARAAKPEQAQSSPPQRGRSLTQSATQERVGTRELEDEELDGDAADFLPASMIAAAKPQRWGR